MFGVHILPTPSALAADKSGVSPNAISLPSGPGSIEGLGEAFQPSLNTGTAKYALDFQVPPGTAGHAPSVSISYEGGGGNGPLGFGWDLPVPYIQRQTDKGIPRYVDGDNQLDDDWDGEFDEYDERDVFINEMKEELVPQADGFFFCENEGAFIRYQRTNDHWVGTLPTGTRLEFGVSASARVRDVASGRTFRWCLERIVDTHGNVITYRYSSFPGLNDLNQIFCREIAYGPGAPPWSHFHFIRFEYEARPDWFEDGRAGFLVRTGHRLTEIIVGTQGPDLPGHLAGDFNQDGLPDHLNRRYQLDYLPDSPTHAHWSLLHRVTQIGADGISELPPATFSYVPCLPPDVLSAQTNWVGGVDEPIQVMDRETVDLVDLNGDGLPDILRTEPFGGGHLGFLNQGERSVGGQTVLQWSGPQPVASEDGLAYGVNLESAGDIAHLADMDGDGLADLVNKSLVGDVTYYANLGTNAWARRRPMSIQDFSPPSPFGNPNVRTADIDFDKRVDVIESVDNGFGADYRVWFNLGQQRYSQRVFVPQSAGYNFSDPGIYLVDFNGDRVPDIVRLRASSISVQAGLGHGRFADPVTVGLPTITLSNDQLGQARFEDVTGDGLTDLVLERAAPGQLWYWINLGNYTLAERKTLTGMPVNLGPATALRWADMNGNGTVDLVYADSTQTPRILTIDIGRIIGCVPRPHLLTTIANGIGRVIRIQYESSAVMALADEEAGQPWPSPLPFPVSVVAQVTTDDSLGNAYITEFRYHDGYYDAEEKEFRGFGRVEQIDVGDATAPTLVTESHFDTGHQHESLKAKLLRRKAATEAGGVFWEETTTWTVPPLTLRTGVNGQSVHFAHPTGSQRRVLELGAGEERVLESEFAYDAFGNRVLDANYGIVADGNRAAFDDERLTRTEFALNTDDWLIRFPSRVEIGDELGILISRQERYYDDPTFSGANLGVVTVGDETLVKHWIDPERPEAYVLASRTLYDGFGNAVGFLDPLALAPGGAPDPGAGHYREVTYDPDLAIYPIRETIHVGQGQPALAFAATYDVGFGTVVTATDANNRLTRYGYDTFGRLIRIFEPGDIDEFPTSEYEYALAVAAANGRTVNYVETRELDRPPGSLGADHRAHYFIRREYLDGLGRNLMSRTEAEPLPGESSPRVVVVDAVLFNARKTVEIKVAPHFATRPADDLDTLLGFEDIKSPDWTGTFHEDGIAMERSLGAAHRVRTIYDALLRQIESTNPDQTRVRFEYTPLAKTSFDENDNDPLSDHFETPMVHVSDGLGRHIRTDEIVRLTDDGEVGQTTVWSTQFQYDLNDRLTRILDSQGNVKRMYYDGLARLTRMEDPDRGTLEYAHDEASNVIETTDARGQHIRFAYDGINRLVIEDYLDEAGPGSFGYAYDSEQPLTRDNRPDVVYFYDLPTTILDLGDGSTGTAADTRGKLAYVWDLSGENHFSYDERGRLAWSVKRTVDPLLVDGLRRPFDPDDLISYRTQYTYDDLDRLTALTYPDNDLVRLDYNDRSQTARIWGDELGTVLEASHFLPAGDPSQFVYGNGVRAAYAFDLRYRMMRLTIGANATEPELLHNRYAYDPVSNIIMIEDKRPETVLANGDPLRNHQEFAYDDLYRVRRVQYSFQARPETATEYDGEIHYRYDRIGNMVSKTSDLIHEERGGSITDLGTMRYGGGAGAWSRQGRDQDAPGPHALTEVGEGNQARVYDYDANGNMATLHGQICTWDFRDRLVALEDMESGRRSEYVYDYKDRRILKKVTGTAHPEADPIDASVYVNQFFEVRGNGQPVKYVWNGGMRVARVTGSISTQPRVQRIRLSPGWNLVSVAVDVVDALGRLVASGFTNGELYRWEETSQTFQALAAGESLAAGDVGWVNVTRAGTWTVKGHYSEPAPRALPANDGVFVGTGLAAVETAGLWPDLDDADIWQFRQGEQSWDPQLNSIMGWTSSNAFEYLLPGNAAFVRARADGSIGTARASSGIHYYHGDHLTSSSIITDKGGAVVEQRVFYPFGATRHRRQTSPRWENYGFVQKEQDEESGLHHVESRYLSAYLGRFCSVDPTLVVPDELDGGMRSAILASPQALNLYAYSYNRPVNHLDPNGNYGINFEIGYSGGIGLGTSGGVGVMIDFDKGLMFYKTYGSGVHIGADMGAGVTAGIYKDSGAFFGRGTATGAGYGKIGGDASFAGDDPSWDSLNGVSGSVGPSIGTGNVHGRATKTEEIWTNKRFKYPRMVPSKVRHKEVHKPQLRAGPVQIQEPVVVTKADVRKGIMEDRRAQWRAEQLKKQNEVWRQTRDAAYYKRILKSSETLMPKGGAANPSWSTPQPDDSMFE